MRAQDRIAVIRALKEQGHTPISIAEASAHIGSGSGGARKIAFIGVAVVAITALVCSVVWVILRPDDEPGDRHAPPVTVAVKPHAPVRTPAVLGHTNTVQPVTPVAHVDASPVVADPVKPNTATAFVPPVDAGFCLLYTSPSPRDS